MAELSMKKFLLISLASLALIGLLPASVAKAHDPIILTKNQSTPADGPLLPDGTISFALYGSLESPADTRGFRVNFVEGDSLYLSILIPDLAPENQLDDASLPFVELTDPSGAKTKLSVSDKVSFAEPFTGTNYVRLTELTTVAISGTYSVMITGNSPSRFTVSVGQKEMFGTPVENISNRDLGVGGVMSWYNNSSTLATETQSPEAQSNVTPSSEPEVLTQTEDVENSQPTLLVTALFAAIVAIAIAVKSSKKRNKNKQ